MRILHKIAAIAALGIMSLLLVAQLVRAATTTYSGEQTLWQDTEWVDEVLIDGTLTIPTGVTLIIKPGALILFTFRDTNSDGIGENEIFIQGTLKAIGSHAEPIRFSTDATNPFLGAWGAINMMSEEENILSHVIVEYGYRGFHAHFASATIRNSTFRYNLRGLQFQESTVSMNQCQVRDNYNGLQFRNSTVHINDSTITGNYWGLRGVYNELTVNNSIIDNNLINGINLRDSTMHVSGSRISDNRKGLYLQRSKFSVENSLLENNSEHGLYLEDSEGVVQRNRISGNGRSGIRTLNFSGQIIENDLSGNGVYGLQNDGVTTVSATNNWWGTVDPDEIIELIRDNRDREGVGLVDFFEPLEGRPSGFPDSE